MLSLNLKPDFTFDDHSNIIFGWTVFDLRGRFLAHQVLYKFTPIFLVTKKTQTPSTTILLLLKVVEERKKTVT